MATDPIIDVEQQARRLHVSLNSLADIFNAVSENMQARIEDSNTRAEVEQSLTAMSKGVLADDASLTAIERLFWLTAAINACLSAADSIRQDGATTDAAFFDAIARRIMDRVPECFEGVAAANDRCPGQKPN